MRVESSRRVGLFEVVSGLMGGRSSGGPTVAEGMLSFSGTLSLENNGGFSPVRSAGRDFDLSDVSVVMLRVRGDGRRYQLRLATDARHRGLAVSYGAGFDTIAGEWAELRLPLATLAPTVRGSRLQGPPLDASQVLARPWQRGLHDTDRRESSTRSRIAIAAGCG